MGRSSVVGAFVANAGVTNHDNAMKSNATVFVMFPA